jgi:hypothetical protein
MELEDEFGPAVTVVGNEKPPRSGAFEVTLENGQRELFHYLYKIRIFH